MCDTVCACYIAWHCVCVFVTLCVRNKLYAWHTGTLCVFVCVRGSLSKCALPLGTVTVLFCTLLMPRVGRLAQTMVDEIEIEDVVSIYVKDKGLSAAKRREVRSQ